eukprot:c18191_g1_i2.p1 GENE.c18191_g1_i2~~c18191_g1_i2.p1  ORF type:complete len:758 (+),score=154.58 c18191_g1_i2:36-2309(+)
MLAQANEEREQAERTGTGAIPNLVVPQQSMPVSAHRLRDDALVLFSCNHIQRTQDLNPTNAIPVGFLLSPLKTLQVSPPALRKEPVQCSRCKAFITRFTTVHPTSGDWSCVLCGSRNRTPGLEPDVSPELSTNIVEYIDPATQPIGNRELLTSQSFAFLIDGTLPAKQLPALKKNILDALSHVPPTARVFLIVFSNILALARLGSLGGENSNVHFDVFAGHSGISDADAKRINVEHHSVSGREAVSAMCKALSHVRGRIGHDDVRTQHRRCFGAAIDLSTFLLHKISKQPPHANAPPPHHLTSAQVLVFLGGGCNYGPGAMMKITEESELEAVNRFYRGVGGALVSLKAAVSLFVAGYAPIGLSVLQPLVIQTGGKTLLYTDYGPSHGVDVARCVREGSGGDRLVTIDIVTPPSLRVSRIIGPSLHLAAPQNSGNHAGAVEWTHCEVGWAMSDSACTVYLDIDQPPSASVHIQIRITYVNARGDHIQRVMTQALPTTDNKDLFVSSIDTQVSAVMVAKLLVLHARSGKDASKLLATHVKEVAAGFGQYYPNFEGRPVTLIHPELSDLMQCLFLLRVGPLLSPILQHPDNIDALRCVFLHASPSAAYRMIRPRVTMFGANNTEHEVSCETLALQSDFVLLVDHQTDIFIWSGRNTSGPEFDVIRQACLENANNLAQTRFPCPMIKTFKEGESMARWLECRMIPSHKDRLDLQVHSFPMMKRLSDQQRATLVAKLPKTDDPSLHQWLRKLDLCIGVYGE